MKAKVICTALQPPRSEATVIRLDLTFDPEKTEDIEQINNLIDRLNNCNGIQAINTLATFWQSEGQL